MFCPPCANYHQCSRYRDGPPLAGTPERSDDVGRANNQTGIGGRGGGAIVKVKPTAITETLRKTNRICTQCGKENHDDDARFCARCGARLVPISTIADEYSPGDQNEGRARGVPEGFEKVKVGKEGNCLFDSIAQAYNHWKQDQSIEFQEKNPNQTHWQMRAACAGSFRMDTENGRAGGTEKIQMVANAAVLMSMLI